MYVIRNTMWVWQVLIAQFYLKNQRKKQLSPENFSLLLLRNTFQSRWAGQRHGETASLINSRKNFLRTASIQCECTLAVYKCTNMLYIKLSMIWTVLMKHILSLLASSQVLVRVNTQPKPRHKAYLNKKCDLAESRKRKKMLRWLSSNAFIYHRVRAQEFLKTSLYWWSALLNITSWTKSELCSSCKYISDT